MRLDYTTDRNLSGGVRFDIRNPPRAGAALLLTSGETVEFRSIGFAGMPCCIDRNGCEQLLFPGQIVSVSDEGWQEGAAAP